MAEPVTKTVFVVRRERCPNWKTTCASIDEARIVAETRWEFAGPHACGGKVYVEKVTTTKERIEL